jgi:phospholipase C
MFLEGFVENKFGKRVREENISAWRRAISGDLTSCFRPNNEKDANLDYLDLDEFVVSIQRTRHKEIPSNFKQLTAPEIAEINHDLHQEQSTAHQEPGMRPSCALPYELYADGSLSADGTHFELRMKAGKDVHGIQAVGAPFNVYLRNLDGRGAAAGSGMTVATYAVKPGDTLTKAFPLLLFVGSRYLIDVHGPNGFYRSFAGDMHGSALGASVSCQRDGSRLTGNVEVLLRNSSQDAFTVSLVDNSYKTGIVTRRVAAKEEASVLLQLQQSHGWYDFTVKQAGSASEARFAGHVDTGLSSFSDPLTGAG